MMRDKFPVGESKNGVQLSFQWGDAFKPKKKVTQATHTVKACYTSMTLAGPAQKSHTRGHLKWALITGPSI